MALVKDATKTVQTTKAVPVDSITLELAMTTHYTRCGVAYEKGKQYKFSRETAMKLLNEMDCGRPMWKIHRPLVVKPKEAMVVDYTGVEIQPNLEPFPGEDVTHRVDIGDESELAELGLDENVTV